VLGDAYLTPFFCCAIREQASLVQEALRQKGFAQARCYFAMRYWHPYTDEVRWRF
jgi:protoheme ferro-lyase